MFPPTARLCQFSTALAGPLGEQFGADRAIQYK